jgi:hydroxymethylglutaryl-CoA synthase
VVCRYVAQADLEEIDNCKGKYTVGLGQTNMAFTDDTEDVGSLFLTVVNNLLSKYDISPNEIGRLEVGTETLTDKSKSVKTTLMRLFEDNTDLEGVTSVNACYGGTAALFNSVAWVESSEWNGKYALVVCGDVAVYDIGPARPTGGCGSIAMLVGPGAPLVIEPGVRASHALDIYDFYKPNHSEYATVDGKLSQWAYLSSVDTCYERYKQKYAARHGKTVTSQHFDYFAFHSPYNKLVQKGFNRIVYCDFIAEMNDAKAGGVIDEKSVSPNFRDLMRFDGMKREDSYDSRDLENAVKAAADPMLVQLQLYNH